MIKLTALCPFPASRVSRLAALGLALTLGTTSAAERLLITNGLIMPMQRGADEPYLGYIAVDQNGKISATGKGAPPAGLTATVTYDAGKKYLIPGFVSAHTHLWQSAFRGLAANQLLVGWGAALRQLSVQAQAEDFYWFTLHGCLNHLQYGVTSAYNFTYGHRSGGEFAQPQWRAELDSGLRFIHSYSRVRDQPAEKQRADLKAFVDYAKPAMNRPAFLRLAISGLPIPAESVVLDAEFMKEYDMSNQVHFLEWPLEKERQQGEFANIVKAGVLGPALSFGHFIHTTDPMLKTVAAAGSGMAWNPLSNGRLASGIADIPKYQMLGVKVGMGVDSTAVGDIPDPFENMRMGLYMIRAKYESALIMQPIDVLRLHTLGSAEVMGVADKVGTLEVGKFGDILVIDPMAMNGVPVFDPYAALVFGCSVLNIEQVYVGGELLVEKRKTLKQDFAQVVGELRARLARLTTPVK